MNILFSNFGDNTIALIQWAYENKLEDVYVLHVETSWAAEKWQEWVDRACAFVEQCGFRSIALESPTTFTDMVVGREQFPSQKFQWCAGFLKGLAFITWADEHDPHRDAQVLLGSRRADSRVRQSLGEYKACSEHFGDRKLWYPLYKHTNEERNALIKRAGFEILHHRSLECDPCIHSQAQDFKQMAEDDIKKVTQLEQKIAKPMFSPIDFGGAQSFERVIEWAQKSEQSDDSSLETFDMGCGAFYGCGE